MSHRCHCFSGECKLLLWDWCSILNRQRKQFSSTFLMLNHQGDLIEFGSAHWGSFHKRTVSKIEFDKVCHISAASEAILTNLAPLDRRKMDFIVDTTWGTYWSYLREGVAFRCAEICVSYMLDFLKTCLD